MYYVVYNISSGNAIDLTTEFPENLSDGLDIRTFNGQIPDLSKMQWEPNLLRYVAKAGAEFSSIDFLEFFTPDEIDAIEAAIPTDQNVRSAMRIFNKAEYISFRDPRTKLGIQYFGMVGLLTPERVSEILSNAN